MINCVTISKRTTPTISTISLDCSIETKRCLCRLRDSRGWIKRLSKSCRLLRQPMALLIYQEWIQRRMSNRMINPHRLLQPEILIKRTSLQQNLRHRKHHATSDSKPRAELRKTQLHRGRWPHKMLWRKTRCQHLLPKIQPCRWPNLKRPLNKLENQLHKHLQPLPPAAFIELLHPPILPGTNGGSGSLSCSLQYLGGNCSASLDAGKKKKASLTTVMVSLARDHPRF